MKIEQEIAQSAFKNKRHKTVVNIAYTYNWLYEKQSGILKPYDISIQQYNILRILRGQHPNPATIKLLKARMIDKMSDVSRLVDKLKTKGLLVRNECPNDRRNVDVIITDKGLELLASLEDKVDSINDLFSILSESELEQLNDYLDRVRTP